MEVILLTAPHKGNGAMNFLFVKVSKHSQYSLMLGLTKENIDKSFVSQSFLVLS